MTITGIASTWKVFWCLIVVTLPIHGESAVSFNMAPIPGIVTITPESPQFPAYIRSLADPELLPQIQAILPFCYFLQNTTAQSISAYSTRWTLTDSSGRTTFQDRTWWNLSTLRGGDAIAPGAIRF